MGEVERMQEGWVEKIRAFFGRISAWVIGPGLGRDVYVDGFFVKLVREFPENTLVVLDADGLYFTCQHPELLSKLATLRTVVTPNHREFRHLNKILDLPESRIAPLLSVTQ